MACTVQRDEALRGAGLHSAGWPVMPGQLSVTQWSWGSRPWSLLWKFSPFASCLGIPLK